MVCTTVNRPSLVAQCRVASPVSCNDIQALNYLTNEFNFWKVRGIMNTSGLGKVSELRSIHDSMNLPKIEFITYIYILYYQSSINFQFSPNFTGFPDSVQSRKF